MIYSIIRMKMFQFIAYKVRQEKNRRFRYVFRKFNHKLYYIIVLTSLSLKLDIHAERILRTVAF